MAFKDRARVRHRGLRMHAVLRDRERDHAIDELKILDLHQLAAAVADFRAITSSMWRQRFFMTKYSSAGASPRFTSSVQVSIGTLMPKALSMAKTMSRKSRLSMPRSSMTWLSGLMFSRGISLVSEMISATLSKVDVINAVSAVAHSGGAAEAPL